MSREYVRTRAKYDISVDWGIPLPEGVGKSVRWRKVRAALNRMYEEKTGKVAFTVPSAGLTHEDLVAVEASIRAAFYDWKHQLGVSTGVPLPDWRTTVSQEEDRIVVFVYDKARLQES